MRRALLMLACLASLAGGEAWRWETGTDPARLWAGTADADPGRAAMAWLVLSIDGDPLEGGVWWPGIAEARRLVAGRLAPTLAEYAPALWVEAIRGRSAAVLAALARFPAEAASTDARLLRAWCTTDWRELAAAPPEPGSFAGLVWLRALLRSGRNDAARAWVWPPRDWNSCALYQLSGNSRRDRLGQAMLVAAWAAEAAAGSNARARAHARRRLRLTWSWLLPDQARPAPAEARALRQRSEDEADADGEAWLAAARGRRQPDAAEFAAAGDEVPDLLLTRALHHAAADQRPAAIVGLLTRWRRLRDGGWCGWWPLVEAASIAQATLRLGEIDGLIADDPLAPALEGRRLPWTARLDRGGFAGFTPTARWREAVVDRDVGNGAWPGLGLTERFAIRWTGRLEAPAAGLYTFATTSDDGSLLLVDDEAVVDNRGMHGPETVAGCLQLTAGRHRLDLRFHDYQWGASCRLLWRPPGEGALTVIPAAVLSGADGGPGLLAEGGPYQGFAIDGAPEIDTPTRLRWVEQAPWAEQPLLALFEHGGQPAERMAFLLRLLDRDPASSCGGWLPQLRAFFSSNIDIRPYAERAVAAARAGPPEWAVAWLAREAAGANRIDEAERLAQSLAGSEFLDYAGLAALVAEQRGDWQAAAERQRGIAERFALPERRLEAGLCLLRAGDVTAALADLRAGDAAFAGWERRREALPLLRAAGELDLACRIALSLGKPDRDSTAAALLLESGRIEEARAPLAYLADSRYRDRQPVDDQATVWLGATVLARLHGGTAPDAGYGADLAAAPGLSPALRQVFAALAGGPPPTQPWWRALVALAAGDAAAARAACSSADGDARDRAACRALATWIAAQPDLTGLRRHGAAPAPGADLGR